MQRFLTIFFVEFLVELDVTSTGCVALCCILLSALYCVVLCCDVMLRVAMSLTCYSTLLA